MAKAFLELVAKLVVSFGRVKYDLELLEREEAQEKGVPFS